MDGKNKTDRFHKLGLAAYSVILFAAIVLLFIAYFLSLSSAWLWFSSILASFASSVLGAVSLFFIVNKFYGFDPDQERQELEDELTENRKRLVDEAVSELKKEIEKLQGWFSSYEELLKTYSGSDYIYQTAINALQSEQWERIRIFAPIGLWEADDNSSKKKWFVQLAEQMKEGKLKGIDIVVGLPPTYLEAIDSHKRTDKVRSVLSSFDEFQRVRIRYYPPSQLSVGFGVIIFERTDKTGFTTFGLCSNINEFSVDQAFGTSDNKVFRNAVSWFDQQIFDTVVKDFVLQDGVNTFASKWDEIISKYYAKATPHKTALRA